MSANAPNVEHHSEEREVVRETRQSEQRVATPPLTTIRIAWIAMSKTIAPTVVPYRFDTEANIAR